MNRKPARNTKDPILFLHRSMLAVALLASLPCSGAQRSLAWDASASAGVAGYYLYYGTAPGHYDFRLDAQLQTTYTIANLADATTYYFAVAAYDSTGAVSGYSNEVSATTAAMTAPTAGLSATPISGTAPLAVAFTSLSSGTITSYRWEFGDGTTSSEQNVAHTYTAAGTYGFKLTVTGPAGSSSATGTVVASAPTPAPAPCQWRNKKKCV